LSAKVAKLSLATPLSDLTGIGPAYVKRLERLGLATAGDLLRYLPRRYDDLSQVKTVDELQQFGGITDGEVITVQAEVLGVRSQPMRNRRMLVKAEIGNDRGFLEAVWFNQPYVAKQLKIGETFVFAGKVKTGYGKPSLQSPTFEPLAAEQTHVARIVPVYPETEGLSSKWLRAKLKPLLGLASELPEPLPLELLHRYDLPGVEPAIKQIHFPDSLEQAERARYRFDFEQILLRQLLAQRSRHEWRDRAATAVAYDPEITKAFVGRLPWPLTDDQRRATHEILSDLSEPKPMMRLLEGDVGSGKTVVAAIAANQVAAAGGQTAIMVPTEVLARQHYQTLQELLAPAGVSVELVVGSQPKSERQAAAERIAAGEVAVVVGTHALIQEGISWHRLVLAVIDEQHRFGVAQRRALAGETTPHLLSMTATPIPRSLALVAFGDQDLSIIEQLPSGRKPIATRLVRAGDRESAFAQIRQELTAGRQAFVVYPVIEDSKAGLKSAVGEFERLQAGPLMGFTLGLLHGRLKADEKEAVMGAFAAGELDVLVATSVIEVGVNVPNATVMVIEEAQQFGLAQLHQFRGRVGRGGDQSYCYLMPGSDSQEENDRLTAMVESTSGFHLAEVDLGLRGPGDLLGTKQSGFDVSLAGLADPRLLKDARAAAEELVASDPSLDTWPELRDRVAAADQAD
jgi:ATP-dependent DNA helicase RecG